MSEDMPENSLPSSSPEETKRLSRRQQKLQASEHPFEFRVLITDEQHSDIRTAAVKMGWTMQDFARWALRVQARAVQRAKFERPAVPYSERVTPQEPWLYNNNQPHEVK